MTFTASRATVRARGSGGGPNWAFHC